MKRGHQALLRDLEKRETRQEERKREEAVEAPSLDPWVR
jgi:hypothetical protein